MLILTRRIRDAVVIGRDISIKVLGVMGCEVRLGITAPKDVTVHREEVYERIKSGAPRKPRSDAAVKPPLIAHKPRRDG